MRQSECQPPRKRLLSRSANPLHPAAGPATLLDYCKRKGYGRYYRHSL